jgi:hypothetical protein
MSIGFSSLDIDESDWDLGINVKTGLLGHTSFACKFLYYKCVYLGGKESERIALDVEGLFCLYFTVALNSFVPKRLCMGMVSFSSGTLTLAFGSCGKELS